MVNPYTAFVGTPFVVERCGIAWYARKMKPEPSMRVRVGMRAPP